MSLSSQATDCDFVRIENILPLFVRNCNIDGSESFGIVENLAVPKLLVTNFYCLRPTLKIPNLKSPINVIVVAIIMTNMEISST